MGCGWFWHKTKENVKMKDIVFAVFVCIICFGIGLFIIIDEINLRIRCNFETTATVSEPAKGRGYKIVYHYNGVEYAAKGYIYGIGLSGEKVPIVIDTFDPKKNYLPEDHSALCKIILSVGMGICWVYDVRCRITAYKQQENDDY